MTATEPDHPAPEAGVDIFVARQPIFRRDLQVHGYELLYRGGPENAFDGTMSDVATARVIANVFLTIVPPGCIVAVPDGRGACRIKAGR